MNMLKICMDTLGRHPLELDWLPACEIPKLVAYLMNKNEEQSLPSARGINY